jgi:uncharacterized protein YndB with AHSA1/START domain
MAKHSVTASALIPAPPQNVYQLIADYRNGHPRILPKPYFIALHVEKGGYGEGTIINYQMRVMGHVLSFRAVITEPTPGHVLVETDLNTGAVTTFTVDPRSDSWQSFVTITTTTDVPDGISGRIQGWLTAQLLRPIYVKELAQLAAVAQEETA